MPITKSNVTNVALRFKFMMIFALIGVILGVWGGYQYGCSKLTNVENGLINLYTFGYGLTKAGFVGDWNAGWESVKIYQVINSKYHVSASNMQRVVDRTIFPFAFFGLIFGFGFYNYFSKKMGD